MDFELDFDIQSQKGRSFFKIGLFYIFSGAKGCLKSEKFMVTVSEKPYQMFVSVVERLSYELVGIEYLPLEEPQCCGSHYPVVGNHPR